MKKLTNLLRGHKNLVFLDFEGTQFSHEMIAYGAVAVTLGRDGRIRKRKEPFRIYVKAHNKIGKYVVELTGITEEQLSKEGVSFATAMNELKKYVGIAFKKSTFITFGNHDMRILGQSIAYNWDIPKEICSCIQKNYMDFSAFLSEFVRDDNGNPMSLIHYCERFGVPEAGKAHDPAIDALNLANLFDAVVAQSDLLGQEYKKVLVKVNNHFPDPVKYAVTKLCNGEPVTVEEFEAEIAKYIE